jgi:predicted HicB family RNase H-like nuclease
MTTTIHGQDHVVRAAEHLYAKDPDWVTFYREILGLRGIMRRHYPTLEALAEFQAVEGYQQIQQMLNELRKRKSLPGEAVEPTLVITVRIPKSLHEALRVEAFEHRTSMNKLCISKLLQFIDNERVPAEVAHEETE